MMSDKKSMESIDFSCFCGVLQEHIHWTWRTPGGGKMGARRGPAPHGHVLHEAVGAGTDFASRVRPRAFAQTEASAAPSSQQLAAIP